MKRTDFDAASLQRLIEEEMKKAERERGRVNVLIAGRSGVGKSTLINSIFEGELARTGQGRPVTLHTRAYGKPGHPISILDTRGLEMADFEATLAALAREVEVRKRKQDPKEHLHVAWICIAEDLRRIEEGESRLAALLAEHMPVIAVITKARADGGFQQEVEAAIPEARRVVRVRALREELDEGYVLEPMGLDTLVEVTLELLPEATQRAFAAAQKVRLDVKISQARTVIQRAAVAAGAVGATPIPFSDAAVIVPLQIGMVAKISSIFSLEMNHRSLATIVGAAATALGGTFTGRAIVGGLLKLLPGAGAIAGGAITSATAAAVTTAFGEAYLAVLANMYRAGGAIDPGKIAAELKAELAKRLPSWRTREGGRPT